MNSDGAPVGPQPDATRRAESLLRPELRPVVVAGPSLAAARACGPVVFLDRDGTINRKAPEGDYVKSPEELELLPRAAEAVAELNAAGLPVLVVTNQRGVSTGIMRLADVLEVNRALDVALEEHSGARVDAYLICPHGHGECSCRKPAPGLLTEASTRWPWINLPESYLVGDALSDHQAGEAAGVRSLLLGTDAADLAEAVDRILYQQSDKGGRV